jgi:tetratricopeptide (TPR) repeat protein
MNKNLLILSLIGLLMFGLLAGAVTAMTSGVAADTAAVEAANQLYLTGHYAEAGQLYEQEVARGVHDAALYYNLGNAYWQQGDLGRALLNLERAAQLDPRDDNIRANLELVSSQTMTLQRSDPEGQRSDSAGATQRVAGLAKLTAWLTINETAVLLLSIWFVLCYWWLARRQLHAGEMGWSRRLLAIALIALLLAGSLSLGSRTLLEQVNSGSIVIPIPLTTAQIVPSP